VTYFSADGARPPPLVLPDTLDGRRFSHHLHFQRVRILNCGTDYPI
jgi:hypothetical protein